jgi:hypothetical protein
LAVALVVFLFGTALLAAALGGVFGEDEALPAPPALPVAAVIVTPVAATPAPAETATTTEASVPTAKAKAKTKKPVAQEAADALRFSANDTKHVPASWVSGFYGVYAEAQKTYGVNWLLIASVHKQETAFSTHPTTYHGLNFAKCCAGPMQFNVTNGPVSTWKRYKDSFARGTRPVNYPHKSDKHPSIYDDFDAIMAAAALLRDSGAGKNLDASAWRAAYDYYGHDLTGVSYASEVLARAIGWGQGSFCINCGTDDGLLGAVDAAWGAPNRTALDAAAHPPEAIAASKKDKKSD